MAMIYGIHQLAKVGEYLLDFDSFAFLVFNQPHQSSTFAVTHLNVQRVHSTPRAVIPKSNYFSLILKVMFNKHFLIAIFELSGADYPHKHVIWTKFAIFEKSKKYYVCVLRFGQKWFT